MEDNNQTEHNQTELQTELDFLFQNSPTNCIEEPEFEYSNVDKKEKQTKIMTETTQSSFLVEPVKKRHPKRFFYNDYYEIYYSNRKNRIMIRNYKTMKYHNIKLSSFLLRYHDGLKQDDTYETRTGKTIIEYFELQLKNGNFLCDFFINENDGQLWVRIKTCFAEYFYDITTHFLILCCNQREYEWYSLFDCDYIDYFIDYEVASNKAQYRILIDWIHYCLKHMYLISHDTTN
jgi:hypothetical protein